MRTHSVHMSHKGFQACLYPTVYISSESEHFGFYQCPEHQFELN